MEGLNFKVLTHFQDGRDPKIYYISDSVIIKLKEGNNNMNGGNNQDKETEGLAFAVTVITAFVGSLYYISYFIQTKSVEPHLYGYASLIMPILILSSISLILYILLKGILMEMPLQAELIKQLKELASKIYILSFLTTIITFMLIVSLIILIIKPESSNYISFFFFIILIAISIINISDRIVNLLSNIKTKICASSPDKFEIFLRNNRKYIWSIMLVISVVFIILIIYNYPSPVDIFVISIEIILMTFLFLGSVIYYKIFKDKNGSIIFGIFMLIFLVLFSPFVSIYSDFFIQGDVKIDMGSIYNKNNIPISISIQLTGSNTELYIKLFNESSDHNLTEIDYIILKSEDTNKIRINRSLMGNSLQNGNFNVFINTIKLSQGYYKLEVNTSKPNRIDAKMFYLLDNN